MNVKYFYYQGSVAKKPYNPIIGETFHCSWKIGSKKEQNRQTGESQSGANVDPGPAPDPTPGTSSSQGHGETYLYYHAEQVSHRPPGE